MPEACAVGAAVTLALRPENVRLGVPDGEANRYTAVVRDMRYQGTQTIYDLDLLGARIETLELGTAARHPVGSEVAVSLPPALTWAYALGV